MIEKIVNILKGLYGKIDLEKLQRIINIAVEEEQLGYLLANNLIPIDKAGLMEKFGCSELDCEFWNAAYYAPDKAIYIHWNRMMEICQKNNLILDQNGKVDFYNLNILLILLHEIEHVSQMKKDIGFEGDILKACFNSYDKDTYAVSPLERFANIYSICQVIMIAKMMEMSDEIIFYFEKKLRVAILNPYIWIMENNEGPTNVYFRNINKPEMIKNYEEALREYPQIIERLFYGLPISKAEKDACINRKVNITSKDFIRYLQQPINYVNPHFRHK